MLNTTIQSIFPWPWSHQGDGGSSTVYSQASSWITSRQLGSLNIADPGHLHRLFQRIGGALEISRMACDLQGPIDWGRAIRAETILQWTRPEGVARRVAQMELLM